MITLYTLPAAFGLRNPSPFCLKIEMALTHLNIDFDIVTVSDPRKAPKGKMPWLVDGAVIPDSELILEHLDKKTNGGLYGNLSAEELATGTAFTRLAEDHLYWMIVASRWLDDEWFKVVKKDFFGELPAPVRWLASTMARKQMQQTYNLHGLGRHTFQEQKDFARRDLEAIEAQLSTSRYIAGDRLTVFDFAVVGILAGLMDNQPVTWISEIANEMTELRDYIERVQKELNVYGRELK